MLWNPSRWAENAPNVAIRECRMPPSKRDRPMKDRRCSTAAPSASKIRFYFVHIRSFLRKRNFPNQLIVLTLLSPITQNPNYTKYKHFSWLFFIKGVRALFYFFITLFSVFCTLTSNLFVLCHQIHVHLFIKLGGSALSLPLLTNPWNCSLLRRVVIFFFDTPLISPYCIKHIVKSL